MFVLGLLLYWALFQFVVKAHEDTRIKNSLLIGFGLTLVLHALAIRLWTADERAVTTAYAGAVLRLGGLAIPWLRLSSLRVRVRDSNRAASISCQGALGPRDSRHRRRLGSCGSDGNPGGKTYLLAFALGTALAGIAGGLVSVSYAISPSIGLEWTLKALVVIVLAGLGSLFGSFAGGIILGLAEAMSVVFLGGPYREVVGLILFLIVLVVRPQGLFGARA